MSKLTYSLRDRLLLTASLVLFIFLGLMGFVLDQAFQRSAEQSVSERLLIQIYGLLSVTDVTDNELYLPEVLQEPRFNNPGSGLFGTVLNGSGLELWRSPSSVDLDLGVDSKIQIHTNLSTGTERFGKVVHDGNSELFYLSYQVLWQVSDVQATPYTFVVLQTMDGYESQITEYRNNLGGWLIAVVVILIGIQGLVMKWGLAPLGQLAGDLKAIEDGHQDYLDGDYPAEIAGVTKNLNLLLSSERQQREKYRTTLADLAHSIKTPLAILKGASSQLESSHLESHSYVKVQETIDEQVVRMDEIVAYQLERAVSDSATLIKKPIAVAPILEKLVLALEKVYLHKAIRILVESSEGTFFGDERDLMEVMGNVIDNGCKYGKSVVKVSIIESDVGVLTITVEDDGPGIPLANRDRILSRGMRLDSQEAGQGIGLAVVKEIVERYAGSLEIQGSDLGGAKVNMKFG